MKKATFTCKICGEEHAGLICSKYRKPTTRTAVVALLAPPKKKSRGGKKT